ncbi:hypothetical protein EYF80_042553 [Liparis tanakae]|uniref:Uncharacterized protein n=1 Tax=Liparis tanakae TaxID=230148 RepID=A0A4Z2G2D9_9TELE|nr:hypothetical protein EYF80_042553 [Liparis tanakae]
MLQTSPLQAAHSLLLRGAAQEERHENDDTGHFVPPEAGGKASSSAGVIGVRVAAVTSLNEALAASE